MSYPYPQDRHRDRKEKGEQPYKDARQTLAENEAELRERASDAWPPPEQEGEDERAERLRAEAEEQLRRTHDEVADQRAGTV